MKVIELTHRDEKYGRVGILPTGVSAIMDTPAGTKIILVGNVQVLPVKEPFDQVLANLNAELEMWKG